MFSQTASIFLVWMVYSVRAADVTIPLGGNAYITEGGDGMNVAMITDTGLEHWEETSTVCSVYFKLSQKETFTLSLRLSVPSGTSKIKVSIKGEKESFTKSITGDESYIKKFGEFKHVPAGYVKLDIQGISKEGEMFGNIFDVLLSSISGKVIYISDPTKFYFGRRGPSVHMAYAPPNSDADYEYFYSELIVPVKNDVVGAYFMANGFKDGYFGMQVNSETQRGFLFSVFSDDPSDNKDTVPAALQVTVLNHGPNVSVETFQGEGTGPQAHYYTNWTTSLTYKYLVYGSPSGMNATKFTAWIMVPGGTWMLMASYLKPTKTPGYLTRRANYDLYSFSENFLPTQGYIKRMATYGNQWVRNTNGTWEEVTKAYFDSDATASNGREDFAGGVTSNKQIFFLKNDGFFNDKVDQFQYFDRNPNGIPPSIDVTTLPQ